jgi:hypothetical protein
MREKKAGKLIRKLHRDWTVISIPMIIRRRAYFQKFLIRKSNKRLSYPHFR